MRIRSFLPSVFLLTLCIFLSGIIEIFPIDEYAVLSVLNEGGNDPDDYLKPPNRILKRKSSGSPIQMSGVRSRSQVTLNVVSEEVTNLRCLLGGGRKIIRHDCMGEDPPSLEVVFTRDVNRPEMRLYDALSSDNGASWLIAGPLSDASMDTSRDRNHVIDFNDDLTYLCYTEENGHPNTNMAYMYWTMDMFKCMHSFNPFVVMPSDSLDENYTQLSMTTNQTAYLSFIDFLHGNPYDIYFRKSTNNGNNWGEYMNISETIGTDGFDAIGYDGPLILDSDGDFIAALTFVNLDPTWAMANGFPTIGRPTYPAYTQSTDGGDTWADLRLIHGNEGAMYPHGHTGYIAFDDSLHYIGGTNDVPWTAFANCQDNCVLTSDGIAHLTYTMRDTTFGYAGVWHVRVENSTITPAYCGFPENPGVEGASGVADMPGLAESAAGHVVIGWTEYMQGSGAGAGDICYNIIAAGDAEPFLSTPINVTNDALDETFQRIVDVIVPIAGGSDEYYIDWLFAYYGEGGNFADSTLWHLQTILSNVGINDKIKYNSSTPRAFALSQNYPNPFNPSTVIQYNVPEGPETNVSLTVYDLHGRIVCKLVNEEQTPGVHRVNWNGLDNNGIEVASGVYFYRLRAGNFTSARKMVLVR